jgi:outer membrane protein assembly factor BamD
VAAANRAQQALREYQQTPSIEEALYILAQSYDKLGLEQLRDDADRVLKQNYPDSRFLREGLRRPDTPWWQFW